MRTNLGLKDLFPKLHLGKILRKKSIANYSLFDFPSSLPSGPCFISLRVMKRGNQTDYN
jgi:hypothetical protein